MTSTVTKPRPHARPTGRGLAGVRLPAYRDQLVRTGHLLTLSSLLTSAIGAIYWAVATRVYGPASVGRSYAAVSAMTLLASVGGLNLGNVLVRFLPTSGARARRLVTMMYLAAAFGAAAAAFGFVLLVPRLSSGLAFLHAPLIGGGFVIGAAAYAIFILQDGALTGLRRPGWVVWENALFALVKIFLVSVLAVTAARAQGILVSWIVALVAAVLVTNGFLYHRLAVLARTEAGPAGPVPTPTAGYITADYAGQLLWITASSLPPIMVLDRLGAVDSAYFSVSWSITNALYMFAINMGLAFVVESAHQRTVDRARLRHMFRHTMVVLGPCVVVAIAAAPLILRIYGTEYQHGATGLLRILVLSALPNMVLVMAVSVARARMRMKVVALVYLVQCVLLIGLTVVLLPVMGVAGAGVAWLASLTVVAVGLLWKRRAWLTSDATAAALAPTPTLAPALAPSRAALPSVSVIICAYTLDRWDDMLAAVGSVRHQTVRPDEIVLVIDHCPELLKRAQEEIGGIRVVPNQCLRGLSGARNTGIRTASHDVLAFLDDDAVADPDWLERLLASYENESVLGVGGLVTPRWDAERPAWFAREFDWVVGCSYRGMQIPVRNFIGANMSFRRDVAVRLGGFRTDLGRVGTRPVGGEDTEFCIRATSETEGGSLVYQERARVRHRVPEKRGTRRYFLSRCFAEGLSKSVVRRMSGGGAGLASERGYLSSAIPAALVRPLRRGPDRPSFATVPMLIAGVLYTVSGFVVGSANKSLASSAVAAPVVGEPTQPPEPTQSPELTESPEATEPPEAQEPAQPVDSPGRPEPEAAAAPANPLIAAHPALRWTLVAATVSALVVALALWIYSLHHIPLDKLGDLGLTGILPAGYWAAAAILTVGFCLTLTAAPVRRAVSPAAYVIALIFIQNATPIFVYSTLRYPWAFKHTQVASYIAAHGKVPPLPGSNILSAYSEWPGFFALNALLSKMLGVQDATSYAAWAPLVFNLLMLMPLLLLFRSVTRRRALIWTGVWIFYVGAWIGEDYFSPQSFSLLLYITFIAVLVHRLTAGKHRPTTGKPRVTVPAAPRFETAMLLVIAAAIITSHQLTPFMLLAALVAVSCKRAYRKVSLPLLAGTALMVVVWAGTVARPFMAANLSGFVSAVGKLGFGTSVGVIKLGTVPPHVVMIANIDRALSATIVVLALLGMLCRRWPARVALIPLVLAPIPIFALTTYGSAVIFRVYLFMLPAAALLAAATLVPWRAAWESTHHLGRRLFNGGVRVAGAGALVVMFVAYTFGNYGNELVNYSPPDQVAAAEYMYSVAPPHSLILAANDEFDRAYTNYWDDPLVQFDGQGVQVIDRLAQDPVGELQALSRGTPNSATFVILTRTQEAAVTDNSLMPAGLYAKIQAALDTSPHVQTLYRATDATVYRLIPEPQAQPPQQPPGTGTTTSTEVHPEVPR
ncbi:O-antigen/teichoic acid export membrane protein/GT2 family glycosyltransferase [Catenulispora sp. GP43]|uniref:glycosyltransferase n=1 Tax=Catenulispora sp. GP43 TaxID=3156263 RepID=UPI003517CF2C